MTLGTALSSRAEGNAGEGVPHLLETWGPLSKGGDLEAAGGFHRNWGGFLTSTLHCLLSFPTGTGLRLWEPGAGPTALSTLPKSPSFILVVVWGEDRGDHPVCR